MATIAATNASRSVPNERKLPITTRRSLLDDKSQYSTHAMITTVITLSNPE